MGSSIYAPSLIINSSYRSYEAQEEIYNAPSCGIIRNYNR